MANVAVLANSVGVPAYERDDGDYSTIELLMGDVPPNGGPVDYPVGANTNLPMFTVVGVVGGVLVPAQAGGVVEAVGYLTVPVNTGAGETTTARVHTSGHYNGNRLFWHASFDTDAKKVAAFPPGKSNILIGFNPYDQVKTPPLA